MTEPSILTRRAALARARHARDTPGRTMLGIAGPPGAGKSTLSAQIAEAVGATVVPMDGFHRWQADLDAHGLAERKGAPETFDLPGFVALLRQLQLPETTVFAPAFSREIEEPVPDAIAVTEDCPLVIVEGNYLLLEDGLWGAVRPCLDECWYVDVAAEVARERLLRRHQEGGRDAATAAAWVENNDMRNAAVVVPTRRRADWVVTTF